MIKKVVDIDDSIDDSAEDCIIVDDRIDRAELRDQITLLSIENPLSLDEFLNLEDKIIINKDSDIFVAIVEYYSVDKPGEEEELSDEKEEEEVEQIEDTEVLRMIERLRL